MDEFLTVKNYKEPLRKVVNGFGYIGCLSQTKDGEKLQCHICGKLFASLQLHVYKTHGIKAKEYKLRFGLAMETALMSDAVREKKKENTLRWMRTFTKEEWEEHMKKRIEINKQIRAKGGWGKRGKDQLETANKRGTCPDQILEKIKEVAKKVGRTPTLQEFINEHGGERYRHLICKVYGSWGNALKILKMTPKERDWKTNYKGTKYDSETLLEYLIDFAREHGRIPTSTDFRRGYLPSDAVYRRHFGTLEQARERAGVYDYVPQELWGRHFTRIKKNNG